jgi:DNA-binding transcriptional MerR regulator
MNHAVRSQKHNAAVQHEHIREAASQGLRLHSSRLYSVKEVAALSGVSIRTLHVYDEMGLLIPKTRTESRYRLYGEEELLRLQQILFYKELDFSLQDIKEILDAPDFDLVSALTHHKKALMERTERLHTLLSTIDKTILHITQGDHTMSYSMTTEELYEGLPKEFATTYRDEAQQRWSEALKRSEEAMRKMSKADIGKLKDEFKENWNALSTMTSLDPSSEAVQERILRHYTLTRKFWGTSTFPDKQAGQFKGLGMLYMEDPRFTVVDGKQHPDFAPFLVQAMTFFADTVLQEE